MSNIYRTINPMQQESINEFKNKLFQERERLIEGLKTVAKPDPARPDNWDARYPQFNTDETGSHSSADEEADEVEEYESRLEAEHSLETQLLEVTKALERIQKETYGICGICKKPLTEERLAANPAAEFCVEHKPDAL